MDAKKKPRALYGETAVDGVRYVTILHGRSRKRVILVYWYWDCTGGLKGWETKTIHDVTFNDPKDAWENYKFFRDAENIRNYVKSRGK